MNEKDITEIMKNMDDSTVEKISSDYGAGDKETKDRLFKEVMRRMDNVSDDDVSGDEVSGVEIYHRSNIKRFISVAATVALAVGVIGGGAFLLRRHTGGKDTIPAGTTSVKTTENGKDNVESPEMDSTAASLQQSYAESITDMDAKGMQWDCEKLFIISSEADREVNVPVNFERDYLISRVNRLYYEIPENIEYFVLMDRANCTYAVCRDKNSGEIGVFPPKCYIDIDDYLDGDDYINYNFIEYTTVPTYEELYETCKNKIVAQVEDEDLWITNRDTGASETFSFPDANTLSFDENYGKTGLDLAKLEEDARSVMVHIYEWDGDSPYDDNGIWNAPVIKFASAADYSMPDYEEMLHNPTKDAPTKYTDKWVFYYPVEDSRFKSVDDIRKLIRSVYTEDNSMAAELNKRLYSDTDSLNEGDLLCVGTVYDYIDFRGKLYQLCPSGGRGSLGTYYPETLPVIIGDKTDKSFTAYVAGSHYPDFNDQTHLRFMLALDVVFDSEINDWCIKDEKLGSYSIYEKLTEMMSK